MDSTTRLLLVSLIVVWGSVLMNYQTLGSIFSRGSGTDSSQKSSGSSSSGSSGSFRVRETYHKIVDKKPDSSSSGSSSSNSDSFRFRKTYHNIVDKKTDKPYYQANNNPTPPPIGWNIDSNKPYNPQSNNNPKPPPIGWNIDSNRPYYPENNNQRPPPAGWNIDSNNPKYYESQNNPKGGINNLKYLATLIKRNPNYGSSSHQKRPGYYYDYNLRPDRYYYIDGRICVNNQNFDGIIYGQLRCPLMGYDYDETECCGPIGYQYCCRPPIRRNSEIGFITGIIFVSIICFCACLCSIGFCLYKYLILKKSTENSTNNEEKDELNKGETKNNKDDDQAPPSYDENLMEQN